MSSGTNRKKALRTLFSKQIGLAITASLLFTGLVSYPAAADESGIITEAEIEQDAYISSATSEDSAPIALGEKVEGLHVPLSASEAIQIDGENGRSGVQIGIPAEGHGEQLPNGSIIYDAESPQAKVVVDNVPVRVEGIEATSVRQLITIGGPEADTRYEFPVDLPEGGRLLETSDGTVTAVDGAGSELGVFAPAWAVDADGKSVPTRYEISDDTLIQIVEHQGAAYPVTADPWWFVLIPVANGVARISVKAASKKAAQEAARKAAIKQGFKPKVSSGSLEAYKGSFIAAKGFTLRKGAKFSKSHSYNSFAAFKKANGNAKSGYEWHHIIEQNMVKNTKGRIPTWVVQNKQNLVQIPKNIHKKCITPIMGTTIKKLSKDQLTRLGLSNLSSTSKSMVLRNYLAKHYSERNAHALGMELMSICGVKVG